MGEWIKAYRCAQLKIKISGPQHGCHLLIAAANVHNANKSAGGVIVERDGVDQKTLTAAGAGAAKDILIDGAGIKKIQPGQLPFAAQKNKLRHSCPGKIGLHRQDCGHGGHRRNEITTDILQGLFLGIEPKGQSRQKENFQNTPVLLHSISIALPHPPGPDH